MKTSIASRIQELVRPVVEEQGYELVDVEYAKEGKNWFLKLYIDQPDGIQLDDCEKVSKAVDLLLDEHDLIPHRYYLEVSSPGIERPLKTKKDFERFAGTKVKVNTYSPVEGKKNFSGLLLGLEDGAVVIETEDSKISIPLDLISIAHLAAEF
ncbi:MAG: ribosome maturation factor RimP [Bacillota bacterium]